MGQAENRPPTRISPYEHPRTAASKSHGASLTILSPGAYPSPFKQGPSYLPHLSPFLFFPVMLAPHVSVAFHGFLLRRGGQQTLPLSRAPRAVPGLTSQLLQIRHVVYSVPAPSDWEQTLWLGKARRPFCPTVANGWWHHCTLGLGCLWAQNFPMDDAHSEGVHNRLGPDISWRPATT